jgi:hypothetical protein
MTGYINQLKLTAMCIIIVNKAGTLPKKTIYNCWDSNPDGAGLMYVDHAGKIVIDKELMKKKLFYQSYIHARKVTSGTIILHFRIGTSGKKDYVNCHPFEVNSQLSFCHNGIISETTLPGSPISDTVVFNIEYLQKLPENWLQSEVIKSLVSKFIGSSKLAFLDGSGQVTLINEHLGHWDEQLNNWYSNYSYVQDEYNFNTWILPTKKNKKARQWHEENVKYNSYRGDCCEYCGKVLISDREYNNGICDKCYGYFYSDIQPY